MRIAFVMGFFLPVPALAGGATEKNSLALSKRFQNRGHEVSIYSRRWPGLANKECAEGIRHVRIPGANHSRHLALNLLKDVAWCLRMRGTLQEHDIIISNSVFFPVLSKILARKNGKLICWVSRMPKGQMKLYREVDGFVAPSDVVAKRIVTECPDFKNRVFQIPNPIDWHSLSKSSKQAENSNFLRIGYVGRIHPEKNLEALLDACELLLTKSTHAWALDFIGPVDVPQGGGGKDYLGQLLRRASPGLRARLKIHSPVFDPEQLADLYGQMDVFCYPSKAAKGEALSVAPLEAMAAGAVPVVSDLDCFRDYVTPNNNGFTFKLSPPELSAQSLAAALERLLNDPTERSRMAKAAMQRAQAFDFEPVADLLLKHFSQMLSRDE